MSLEMRFQKIEDRLSNNQKLMEISDKMLEIKNDDNQINKTSLKEFE